MFGFEVNSFVYLKPLFPDSNVFAFVTCRLSPLPDPREITIVIIAVAHSRPEIQYSYCFFTNSTYYTHSGTSNTILGTVFRFNSYHNLFRPILRGLVRHHALYSWYCKTYWLQYANINMYSVVYIVNRFKDDPMSEFSNSHMYIIVLYRCITRYHIEMYTVYCGFY